MKEGEQKDKLLTQGFISNRLNPEESAAFRKRMEDDAFQEKVSEEVVQQYGQQQLKSKLEKIHQTVAQEQKKRRRMMFLFCFILLAIAAFISWLFIFQSPSSPAVAPAQLFAQYFEPYPSIFEQKGTSSIATQNFLQAHKAYSEEEYAIAAQLFAEQLEQDSDQNSFNSFYFSLSLLANKKSNEAISELEQLKKNTNTLLPQAPLYWYLSLAYLQENRTIDARPLLEWLAAQHKNKFKQQESAELLQRL